MKQKSFDEIFGLPKGTGLKLAKIVSEFNRGRQIEKPYEKNYESH